MRKVIIIFVISISLVIFCGYNIGKVKQKEILYELEMYSVEGGFCHLNT